MNSNPTIKRYTKKELALLYFPSSSPDTARHHLMDWIKRDFLLKKALHQTGYRPTQREFTAQQVRLIFEFLGEP